MLPLLGLSSDQPDKPSPVLRSEERADNDALEKAKAAFQSFTAGIRASFGPNCDAVPTPRYELF